MKTPLIATFLALTISLLSQDATVKFDLIPYSAELKTQRDFDKSVSEFCDRLIGARCKAEASVAERVSIMAEDCIRHMAHDQGAPNAEKLFYDDANGLLFEGKSEPVMDTWLSYVLSVNNDRGNAERRLNEALSKIIAANPADPISEFFARLILSSFKQNDESNLKAAANALAKAYETGAVTTEDSRIVYKILNVWSSPMPTKIWGLASDALSANQKVDPWLRKMIESKKLMNGIPQISGVPFMSFADGPLYVYKGKNRKIPPELIQSLTDAWKANPAFPEAPAELLGLSAVEDSKTWFQRTIKAQFDYMPAYEFFAEANAGTPETIATLARECAMTERFDTPIPLFHFRCLALWCDSLDYQQRKLPYTAAGEMETLLKLVKGINESQDMAQEEKDRLLLTAAFCIHLAGDDAKAAQLMKAVPPSAKPRPGDMPKNSKLSRETLEAELMMSQDPCAKLCEEWMESLSKGEVQKTRAIALEICAKADTRELKDHVARGTALLVAGMIKPSSQLIKIDPLRIAVATKSDATFEFLKESGWLKDCAPEGSIDSALRMASAMRSTAMIEKLIDAGANVAAKDEHGLTALHYAARINNNVEVIKLLLAKGADPNATDANGLSALDLARKSGIAEHVELLSKREAQ